MKDLLTSPLNYIEKQLYEGFSVYMDFAESEITECSISSKEQKESVYEKFRRAFFLMRVEKMHNDSRESDLHKVVLPLTRICLKKGLYDFYQMRTMKADKLEKENSYKEIVQLIEIKKNIEDSEFYKKGENVNKLINK